MLVAKLELWPFGNEAKKQELGRVNIINYGQSENPAIIGNYKIELINTDGITLKTKTVKGYQRYLGPWKLLQLALEALFKGK